MYSLCPPSRGKYDLESRGFDSHRITMFLRFYRRWNRELALCTADESSFDLKFVNVSYSLRLLLSVAVANDGWYSFRRTPRRRIMERLCFASVVASTNDLLPCHTGLNFNRYLAVRATCFNSCSSDVLMHGGSITTMLKDFLNDSSISTGLL